MPVSDYFRYKPSRHSDRVLLGVYRLDEQPSDWDDIADELRSETGLENEEIIESLKYCVNENMITAANVRGGGYEQIDLTKSGLDRISEIKRLQKQKMSLILTTGIFLGTIVQLSFTIVSQMVSLYLYLFNLVLIIVLLILMLSEYKIE